MQSFDLQQQQRTEAKEDYVWQAEKSQELKVKQDKAEEDRKRTAFNSLLSGEQTFSEGYGQEGSNLKISDYDDFITFRRDPVRRQAHDNLGKIKSIDEAGIYSELKNNYEGMAQEDLVVLTDAKRSMVYNSCI